MSVSRRLESFTDEIPQVPEADKDHVADIGREQDVIGRVLLVVVRDRLVNGVLRGETECLVRAMSEF